VRWIGSPPQQAATFRQFGEVVLEDHGLTDDRAGPVTMVESHRE